MKFNTELKSDEFILIGSWKIVNGNVVSDEVCQRIENLIDNYLKKVSTEKTGWEILYQDKNDNRYWLLTFPKSDWHGGGPPTLKMLTEVEVSEKF